MATTPEDLPSVDEDVQSGHDDEDTLQDERWAVPDQYRIDDEDLPRDVWPGTGQGERPRRFPPDIGPGLLVLVVAALLLVPAAILASSFLRDDDEPAPEAATTTAPGTTGPARTTPSPPTRTAIPDVVGEPVGDARAALEEAGFTVRTELEPSDRPAGEVLAQSPSPDTRAERNAIVLLAVSGGVDRITVPKVVGLTEEEATAALRRAGLRPDVRLVSSRKTAGTVLGQRPGGDARVDPDTVVRLDVAEAPPEPVEVDVPEVVGLTVADARASLRRVGLRSTVTKVESSETAGTVVGQSPRAGTKLDEGATVSLRVSTGPARVTIDDVTGLDEVTARQQLEAAGLQVEIVDEPTSDVARDGIVVGQDPPGGTRADEGSVVTLTVARLA
jgi:beta-lactam-binding protein with PASTA domain